MITNTRIGKFCLPCLLLLAISVTPGAADEFDVYLTTFISETCQHCHGLEEANGKINLQELRTAAQFLESPQLLEKMIRVIDAYDMPPASEPKLEESVRGKVLTGLKALLRTAAANQEQTPAPIRRLNRFQYNNAVKDLLQLKGNVFKLPEKLMTRRSNYLNPKSNQMPDRVQVLSESMNPQTGLKDVRAFPKDLRASHGFDNQANQLTLSPLLLDAFLRLSVSIVESPDFNESNVGIWNIFFKAPTAGTPPEVEVKKRLEPFLQQAFRRQIQPETLDRYATYAIGKMAQNSSFTDGMKKVVAAVLSSPLFLYRYSSPERTAADFELASNLSFFLWGSLPDKQLLELAAAGQLTEPKTLNQTLDRMFADPKIERFLDTFPAQWMQLENVLAATPDPQQHRLFSLDKNHPASLQMVLEPLLLFDAVFIENRPLVELLAPSFSYQSPFLKQWYTSDLKPPQIDARQLTEENRRREQTLQSLRQKMETAQTELEALLKPVRNQLLAVRKKEAGGKPPVDLKPYAAWDFDGNLKSSANKLDLKATGKISYQNGMVVLERAYLQSPNLPIDLKAKTLEVWCELDNLDQRGGGVMGIQGPGDFFDTIVLGERKPRHWISGSNGFSRTEDFPESTPEKETHQRLHLVMVYQENGTTRLYRNGQPYGKPFRKGSATFPKDRTSVLFGLRHLPAGGNRFLSVRIDKARLYTRALTSDEVAAATAGDIFFISNIALLEALSPQQITKKKALETRLQETKVALEKAPRPEDLGKLQQAAQQKFENNLRGQLRGQTFERLEVSDARYGGIITNAAMLSMTSGPKRTHPIARGAWIIEVIFNDPPPPPPNDVPALNDEADSDKLTIRERFAKHRENPDCAGCHARLDPLGFALENFDVTGRWRDHYTNGRDVDPSGTLLRKYEFDDIVRFKNSLVAEKRRFAKAFTAHLLRFALSRELRPVDALTVDAIVNKTEEHNFALKSLIREVVQTDSFRQSQ
ncbi:MAG: hypothetical protein CMJ75_08560 [Planctomycetaceae bacterium]|nr:hypothetical protein [Planctomycetaceae bacterium]